MSAAKGTPYSGSGAAVNAVLWVMDVGEDIGAVGVQVIAAGVGTITYEVSQDQSVWVAILGFDPSSASPTWTSTSTAVGLRVFPVQGFKYVRARLSAWTSGTFTAIGVADTSAVAQGPVSLLASSATLGGFFGAASSASNGATLTRVTAGATTNLTLVKATAGKVVGGILQNNTATVQYVRFYNKATVPLTTDTPLFMLTLQANQTIALADLFADMGISFNAGIGYDITVDSGDNGSTATTLGAVTGFLLYA